MQTTNLKPTILVSFFSVLVMFALYFLTEARFFGDNPVGQGSNFNEPSIVPQPYAFAIWGVIYLFLLMFPLYQYTWRDNGDALWKQVHYWFSANVIANGVWLAAASMDWLIITTFIILFMLVSLYKINELLIKIRVNDGGVNYWTEQFGFSVYFAWITLASALNITAALVFYQWDGFGLGDIPWSVAILSVAALIAGVVYLKYKDVAYAGVIIWAFIALVVKHITDNPVLGYLSIAVAAIFGILVLLESRRKLVSK